MAETTVKFDDDGTWEQFYRCTGNSFFISETQCDKRQERGTKGCNKCTLKIGAKNDPRSGKE